MAVLKFHCSILDCQKIILENQNQTAKNIKITSIGIIKAYRHLGVTWEVCPAKIMIIMLVANSFGFSSRQYFCFTVLDGCLDQF
jgi:hypothetical protein